MLPLPGRAAICASSTSLVPASLTTDQHGFPRLNTAYTGSACVDAGAVQTNYQSVKFSSSSYSGEVNQAVSPAPVVSVTENGQSIGGVPVTLAFSGTGTATGLGPVTTTAGVGATFSSLTVDTVGSGDTLSATLQITPTYSITTNPNATLDITLAAQTITFAAPASSVTYGAGPIAHMRALVQLQNGTIVPDIDYVFNTGALPQKGLPTLTATATGQPCPGVELVNMNPQIPVVTDLQGNIIWYYLNQTDLANNGHPMPIKPLPNGNMMALITNRYTGHPTPYCVLREVDLASETVSNQYRLRELEMPVLNQKLQSIKTPYGRTVQVNYFSHDFLPLPNGHVILLCQEFVNVMVGGQQTLVWGDALVDLDESFSPVWVWSAFDVLDPERHPFLWTPDHDWTHCNTVASTPDGNLLLSVRDQSWVLKLDYANGAGKGDILWKLGFQGTFELQNSGPGGWFFAQHFPHVLETSGPNITTLAVVDNGNYRPGTDPPPFSRGLILNIDETHQTATVTWQYPVSPSFFSYWGGNVVQLPNGNMEICMSHPSPTESFVVEVTYDQQEVVWRMDISPAAAYRSYRIPSLYPGVQW